MSSSKDPERTKSWWLERYLKSLKRLVTQSSYQLSKEELSLALIDIEEIRKEIVISINVKTRTEKSF